MSISEYGSFSDGYAEICPISKIRIRYPLVEVLGGSRSDNSFSNPVSDLQEYINASLNYSELIAYLPDVQASLALFRYVGELARKSDNFYDRQREASRVMSLYAYLKENGFKSFVDLVLYDKRVLIFSVAVDRFNNYMLEQNRKEVLAVVNGSPVLALRLK
jgi:hypothetical protein